MSATYDNLQLESKSDFKFFGALVGERLRNTNFKPKWREVFLKTLLEQIKPVTSIKCYDKIDKMIHEVGHEKHQEEIEAKKQREINSNRKNKNLVSLKAAKDSGFKRGGKYGMEDQGDFISDSEEDY